MPDPGHWINAKDPRRRVTVLAALVLAMLLFGFLCHHPEALGLATGHTHLGQPSGGHCWTAIASLPAMDFIAILFALLSFTLTFQGPLLAALPFKPPRAS